MFNFAYKFIKVNLNAEHTSFIYKQAFLNTLVFTMRKNIIMSTKGHIQGQQLSTDTTAAGQQESNNNANNALTYTSIL